MAQDFGDDMGNALLNFVTRQTENYLRFGRGRERAFDWWQRHYKKEGNTPEAAKAMAEKQSSREQVVVPFGTSEEAAYYAQVCRENGTYAAVYTDVGSAAPKDKKAYVSKDKTIDKANGKPRIWQVLRLARIEKAELVKPTKQINIPNMPVSELRKWSFDNGTDAVFITDQRDLAFIKTLPGATVEQCGAGEKVHLTVSSDSWFVAFCIAHARHITAVAPETLRTMIVARAERELSISENK